MEMIRHQDLAEKSESQFGAQPRQWANEFALEALGIENRRAAIGAGGQKVKVVLSLAAT